MSGRLSAAAVATGLVLASCNNLRRRKRLVACLSHIDPRAGRHRCEEPPKLLVLYHRANPGRDRVDADCEASGSEAEALDEMRRFYSGVVEAHDLDVF